MATAVIVDAVRTAVGMRNGKLSGWHPVDLAGTVLDALVRRSDLDPALIDDVVMGCVTQVGDQALNIARNAVLAAGWPESIPGVTVDRQCGSSQQAVHFAAQGVIAGAYDVVVAAGVECMSTTPVGSSVTAGSRPFGPRVMERYAGLGGLVPQGAAAEFVAERWSLGRDDLDAYAAASHLRAERAVADGRFAAETVAVQARIRDRDNGHLVILDEDLRTDEGVGRGATLDALAALKPAFSPLGRVTAGNSAPVGDGAAAVLIMSEERAVSLGLRPMARFRGFALAGVDPLTMLSGPIEATARVLERAKLDIGDIDAFEVNEAFASVVLAWAREHRPDMERVNPDGGAIALGHPLGCSGARLLSTLVHGLSRTRGRVGLQAMSEGGGQANALVIERMA